MEINYLEYTSEYTDNIFRRKHLEATQDTILAMGRKFMESRIFLTAAELDLFTLLSKKPMTAGETADKLKVTLRGITVLLDAVAAMGLLEKINDRYHCPADVSSILSGESAGSVMPMVMHSAQLWKRWSNLTDIVRDGFRKSRPPVFESGDSEVPESNKTHFTVFPLSRE